MINIWAVQWGHDIPSIELSSLPVMRSVKAAVVFEAIAVEAKEAAAKAHLRPMSACQIISTGLKAWFC